MEIYNLTTLGDYLPLFILVVLAGLIAAAIVGLSFILGPKQPNVAKNSTYECGVEPVGDARNSYPVKFSLVAMLFILFDIETVFLYPWAVLFRNNLMISRSFLFGEMAMFITILFVGYVYVWKKGALDWE
jgi:NADH-quinone oxidoreductase subunit A